MSNTVTINEFAFKHIADWTIFPWIEIGCVGWKFTWLFFQFTRFTVYESELNGDDDFPDDGA
jgi:hypothetical protein